MKKARVRPVYFETTIPVIRLHGCGVWVAAGVAEGIKAEIEFVPLDFGQQMWCIVNRVEMYAMRRMGLTQMDELRLTDPKFRVLFPQHYCHISWPAPAPPIPGIAPDNTVPF